MALEFSEEEGEMSKPQFGELVAYEGKCIVTPLAIKLYHIDAPPSVNTCSRSFSHKA
jgi:hypothetical protein